MINLSNKIKHFSQKRKDLITKNILFLLGKWD